MNTVNKFEYIVNMMYKEKILLVQKQILSMQNKKFVHLKFKHEKAFRFGVQIQKKRFHQVFYEKTVNNFLNNAKQKIILCRMLEVVYAKNSEQFELMQKINFMNALSGFKYRVTMMCRVHISLMQIHILSMQKNKFDHFEI